LDATFPTGKTTITHCQFLDFPASGTPQDATTFLSFRAAVDAAATGSAGSKAPMVVHCENGCGRTGAFICLDSELQRLQVFGDVDLMDAVTTARRHRARMVETDAQYIFLHRAFVTELLAMDNEVIGTHPPAVKAFLAKFTVYGARMGGGIN
jgi:protein tyrosine phosphatase